MISAMATLAFAGCGSNPTPPQPTVTATVQYSAQANVGGAPKGTVAATANGRAFSSGASFDVGTTIVLTATANAGFNFAGWYAGNVLVKNSNYATYQFTLAENVNLQAHFDATAYRLAYQSDNVAQGTVVCASHASGANVPYGGEFTLTANGINGYEFEGWYDESGQKIAEATTATYTFTMPAKPTSITAKFVHGGYALNFAAEANGVVDGGTLASGALVRFEQGVTLTAVADAGYRFAGWYLVEGLQESLVGEASNVYTFAMPQAPVNLKAKFEKDSFALAYSADVAKGTIQTTHVGAVALFDAPVTLTAVEKEGFDFAGWYKIVAGQPDVRVCETAAYTFNMPAGDLTLEARFVAEQRTVTFWDGLNKVDEQVVDFGTTATNCQTQKPNHTLLGWLTAPNGTLFDFATAVTSNLDLYASWLATAVMFDVVYEYEDSSVAYSTQIEENEALYQLPHAKDIEGYTFDGWYYNNGENDVKVTAAFVVTSNITFVAKYNINAYAVNFFAQSGDLTPYATQTVQYNQKALVPTAPAHPTQPDDFMFDRWVDASQVAFNFNANITEAIDLFATWVAKPANTFVVTFKVHQADIDAISTQTVAENGVAILPADPQVVGKTFVQWVFGDGTQQFTAQTQITAATTVWAQFEDATYQVEFKGFNGASLGTQVVAHGQGALAPTPPSVEGYVFVDWDAAFNNVTSAMTINANYEILKRTVKFIDGMDLEAEPISTVLVNYGQPVPVPQTPSKAGCEFVGWFATADYATAFNFTAPITFAQGAEPLQIFAKFDQIVYHTVRFVMPDNTEISTQQVLHGADAILPSAPQVEGYTFATWSPPNNAHLNITANITITAQYTPNEYAVTFVQEDGTTVVVSITVAHGQRAAFPQNAAVPQKPNYTFVAWQTSRGEDLATLDITKATTFLPTYAQQTCTVTFMLSQQEEYLQYTIAKGAYANIPTTPSQTGYKFKYWYATENVPFQFDQVQITQNTTLYAHFDELPIQLFTVVFKVFEGDDTEIGTRQQIASGGEITEPAPYSDGTAQEYFWSIDGTTPFNFSTIITNEVPHDGATITIYAVRVS